VDKPFLLRQQILSYEYPLAFRISNGKTGGRLLAESVGKYKAPVANGGHGRSRFCQGEGGPLNLEKYGFQV
jgi:hypothetical protein